MPVEFNEENILKLFGNEAAENESIKRLKEYYFKSSIFPQVCSNTPLRILVGHKGIGKSALIKVAISEDEENGRIPLLIRPDDILGIASGDKSILELIRDWKEGLSQLLTKKLLKSFGVRDEEVKIAPNVAGRIISFVTDTLKKYYDKVNLEPAQQIIIDSFLKNKRITIYLDDLDRGWEGTQADIKRISALLNTVRDLSSDNPGLLFRIALRSDVYFLVRTSDESTDKIEGSVIWYSWTNHEILVLLIKRIETFFGRFVDESLLLRKTPAQLANYLRPVMEPRFPVQGHWINAPLYRVLMSLIRKRPRDLIKLCTAAARQAFLTKSHIIQTKHLKSVFEDYSQGRIQDTMNEYRSELHDIERLLMGMKPNKKEKTAKQGYCYTTEQLFAKIDNINQSGNFTFSNRKSISDKKELANFLYKINFLTARKVLPDGEIQRKYFEENRYLSNKFVDFGYEWEVHPAYRWALQPDSLDDLFATINLSSDE